MLRIPYPVSYAETHWLGGLPRGKLIVVARWLVTVLLVWLILRSIDTAAVLDLIARANLPGLGLAGMVVAVQFIVVVLRWKLVMRLLGGEVIGFGALSVVLGYSFLVGQALPSSVGGDVARTLMLARLTGAAVAARSVVYDRLLGFTSLGLLAAPTLPIIAGKMVGLTPILMLAMTAPAAIALLVLAFLFIIRAVPRLRCLLTMAAGDLRCTLCSGKVSLIAVTLGMGSSLLNVLLICILGSAVGADLRVLDCLVLVPSALLVSALPISLGGWGVREGAMLASFSLVQANPAGVAATSVMFGLTTPLAGAVVIAASLFADRRAVLSKGSRDEG